MAKRTRTYLKTRFENGDKPPQEDFWDWLDSFWHLDEVPGGVTINGGTGGTTHAIPAGTLLREIVVFGNTPGVITIARQTSGGDILTDEPYTANGNPTMIINEFFKNAETLGFSGYTGTVTIKLFYQ